MSMRPAARLGAAFLAVALVVLLGAASYPSGGAPPSTGARPTTVVDPGKVGAGVGGGLDEYPGSLAPTAAVRTTPVAPAPAPPPPPPPSSTEVAGRSGTLFYVAGAVGLLVLGGTALLLRRSRRR